MSRRSALILGAVLLVVFLVSFGVSLGDCGGGGPVTDPGCASCAGCMVERGRVAPAEIVASCFVRAQRRFDVLAGATCAAQIAANDELDVRTLRLSPQAGTIDAELVPRGDGPKTAPQKLEPVSAGDELQVYQAGATLRLTCRGATDCQLTVN